MKLSTYIVVAFGCFRSIAAWPEQAVMHSGPFSAEVMNVAIIGAGAGGASSAFHLSKLAASAALPVNITVFERNPYVGGRSTTVNAYDDPSIPVELGASIFVQVNHILVNAVEEFNLSTTPFIPETDVPGDALGIWDGQGFALTQGGKSNWFDKAKLILKYGLAPIRAVRLVDAVISKFLRMYDEPAFPFESLTQVAQDLGLLAVTAATGEQYLEENGITGPFGREVIQSVTRVNYAQNLNYIHGLEAMVSMAADNARSVRGGNWQIFDRMIKASNAALLLDTPVLAARKTNGMYELRFGHVDAHYEGGVASQLFDAIIMAGPAQFSDIQLTQNLELVDPPAPVPYVKLHVTLFASPHLLSPTFFNMKPDDAVPRVILTTLPKDEKPQTGPAGVGTPGFFSISLLSPVTNPNTGGREYLYKIFSASPPNSTFLSSLLGLEQQDREAQDEVGDQDITWMYRKVWNSYPYEYPRVTFERIQLDDSLWYTGGMDSFISTMETNALMGMNVARLIVDEWIGKSVKVRERGAVAEPASILETGAL